METTENRTWSAGQSRCADCTGCLDVEGGVQLCVEKIEFLQGIPADRKRRIIDRSSRLALRRGSVLFEEGAEVDALYIILSGRVKLSSVDSEGREKIAGIFSDHDTIWEGIFLQGSRYPYSGICLTEVHVCKLYRRDVEDVIRDPAVAQGVIGMLSRKLHDANERNLILGTSDPKARIAGLLLYRKARIGDRYITLRLDDIAASINLRPETVSRKLGELEREGRIRKRGQSSWEILDYEGLKELVGN